MDPKACFERAETAINGGDAEEAADALASYWAWRRGGGFAPKGGDKRAEKLAAEIQSLGE